MDRGFGGVYRSNNFGSNSGPNFRDRYERDDRRYDDFYSDNRGGGAGVGAASVGRGGMSIRNSNRMNNFGNWGGSNRDRGFFNQTGLGNDRGNATGNASGQMLAALQQQQNILNAFMNTQSRAGILPPPQNNNRFGQGGNRFGNNRRASGGGGARSGEKRKYDLPTNPSGFNKRDKRSKGTANRAPKKGQPAKTKPNKEPAVKQVEELPDIPDDEVEIPDSIMDSVETLRQRKDVVRNVADEDVEKLSVFCFTGKGYQCKTCGFILNKETAFLNHLNSKSHVMNVIESRAAKKYQEVRDVLDIDLNPDDWYEKSEKAQAIILKQSKLYMKAQRDTIQKELENYNKNPKNFYSVNMETRKSALKKEDTVIITSLVEATIEVKEFAKNRFFGCEFVKAVSGFQCRLCNTVIEKAENVVLHIDSRQHKTMYQAHLRKNPNYEKEQSEQNSELCKILGEHEEENVLLYETVNAGKGQHFSILEPHLVRVPRILNPEKKVEKDSELEQTDGEEKDAEESKEHETVEEEEESNSISEEAVERQDDVGTVKDMEADLDGQSQPIDDVERSLEESLDVLQEVEDDAPVKEVEKVEEELAEVDKETPQEQPKPKKSILKKQTKQWTGTPRRGGRCRGAKTPSPVAKLRRKAKEEVEEVPVEQEDSNDGNFMDGFHVVDEVEED